VTQKGKGLNVRTKQEEENEKPDPSPRPRGRRPGHFLLPFPDCLSLALTQPRYTVYCSVYVISQILLRRYVREKNGLVKDPLTLLTVLFIDKVLRLAESCKFFVDCDVFSSGQKKHNILLNVFFRHFRQDKLWTAKGFGVGLVRPFFKKEYFKNLSHIT